MKKYLSVFAMIARSSLYRNLFVMFLVVSAQILLFLNKLEEYGKHDLWTLEGMVKDSYMILPLVAGFIIITIFLGRTGCNYGSNQGYTLRRLQITEHAVLGLQVLYNGISYVLLWASQVAVLMIASYIYITKTVEWTNQTIMLAFYRNSFMHTVLPMADIMGWVLLILSVISLSEFMALFAYYQRYGKLVGMIPIAFLLGCAIINFPRGVAHERDILIIAPLLIAHMLLVKKSIQYKTREGKVYEQG